MKSKKFLGYLILGAANEQDAEKEKGLLVWLQHKPNAWVRFWNRVFLGIYWIDKERVLEVKEDRPLESIPAQDEVLTQMTRVKPVRKNPYHGKQSENTNSKRGS